MGHEGGMAFVFLNAFEGRREEMRKGKERARWRAEGRDGKRQEVERKGEGEGKKGESE